MQQSWPLDAIININIRIKIVMYMIKMLQHYSRIKMRSNDKTLRERERARTAISLMIP